MIKRFPVSPQLNENKVNELLERIPYLSEHITGVEYDIGSKLITIHSTADDSISGKLDNDLKELVEALSGAKILRQKTIKDNTDQNHRSHLDSETSPQPKVAQNNGFYNEVDIELLTRLDDLFASIAKKYNAAVREYPIMLDARNMSRNRYHKNFPQNVYSVGHIPHNYSFIKQIKEIESDHIPAHFFENDGNYLRPCLCYHCYEEIQDSTRNQQMIFTTKGKCFRHEINWKLNDFRRNEFTMREIVYVGEKNDMLDIRKHILEDTWSIFNQLGLTGRVITARDPFFHYDDMKNIGLFQLMSDSKYELEAVTPEGFTCSIASFNYCEDLLCKKFNIRSANGEYLYSGCVGFGIDRWRAAILATVKHVDEIPWEEIKYKFEKTGGGNQ